MKIYIAANYTAHPQMRDFAALLAGAGHLVTSEWISGTHKGDDHADYAQIDLRDLDAAEAVILFSQDFAGSRTRGGKHVEFGYGLAKGKRMYLIGERRNVFHWLDGVRVFPDAADAAEHFRKIGPC